MTEIAPFETFEGRAFRVAFEPTRRETTQYCVALHKSGSVLFDQLVKAMCAAAGVPTLDVAGQLFDQGVNFGSCDADLLQFCGRPGYVYTGFRGMWQLQLLRLFRRSRKLVLVRDPRDIAVSFYHSMAKSHAIPAAGEVRDAMLRSRERAVGSDPSSFVLGGGVDGVFGNFNQYAMMTASKAFGPWALYRYEDVIYRKSEWAAEIATQLEISLPSDVLDGIVGRHDVFPEREDPSKHIRRVHPGGFKDSLSTRAIAYIEERCARGMKTFGYATAE